MTPHVRLLTKAPKLRLVFRLQHLLDRSFHLLTSSPTHSLCRSPNLQHWKGLFTSADRARVMADPVYVRNVITVLCALHSPNYRVRTQHSQDITARSKIYNPVITRRKMFRIYIHNWQTRSL